jgi:hypothetical protein
MRPVRGQRKSATGSSHNIALVYLIIILSKRKEGNVKKFNNQLKVLLMKNNKIKHKYIIYLYLLENTRLCSFNSTRT